MAKIGLLRPYYAKYSNVGSTVTYSGGRSAGKYVSIDMQLEDGSDNDFYADDSIAETDPGFSGGTITNTTDDLRPEIAEDLLGLTRTPITQEGLTTQNAAWLDYDDNQAIPFIGWGGVIRKKVDGAVKFVAFVYPKIKFRNPNEATTTRGAQIEWQTPELVADISRSDEPPHRWYRKSTLLDTLEDAEVIVKAFLNITDGAAPDPESNGGGG